MSHIEKICTKCNIEKSIEEFSKNRGTIDGHAYYCKECTRSIAKQYRKDNATEIATRVKVQRKVLKENNPEQYKEYRRRSERTRYKKNRAKYNEKRIARTKRKMNNDPLYRTSKYIRTAITNSLTRNGFMKRSKTYEILGCTFEEFYVHIERQFLHGMNWENRSEWHIDHIVPISFGTTEEEIVLLNHYTNLRPLWGKDNLKKSDALTEESINHPIYEKILSIR